MRNSNPHIPAPAVAATVYNSAAADTGLDEFNLELPAMTVPADQKTGAYKHYHYVHYD